MMIIASALPGQETGGTQRHLLTVAIFRSWRGLEGSAAPGLPGRKKHTREGTGCQTKQSQVLQNINRLLSWIAWARHTPRFQLVSYHGLLQIIKGPRSERRLRWRDGRMFS